VADEVRRAVAISYDESADEAPNVIAKGRGLVADKIVETALEAEIPIVEDVALVSALLMLEFGDEIPVELYQSIARILTFLYEVDKDGDSP
jgi:flagellar biosynthesis protein